MSTDNEVSELRQECENRSNALMKTWKKQYDLEVDKAGDAFADALMEEFDKASIKINISEEGSKFLEGIARGDHLKDVPCAFDTLSFEFDFKCPSVGRLILRAVRQCEAGLLPIDKFIERVSPLMKTQNKESNML